MSKRNENKCHTTLQHVKPSLHHEKCTTTAPKMDLPSFNTILLAILKGLFKWLFTFHNDEFILAKALKIGIMATYLYLAVHVSFITLSICTLMFLLMIYVIVYFFMTIFQEIAKSLGLAVQTLVQEAHAQQQQQQPQQHQQHQ